MTLAALYVLENGPYANLPGVEVWGPTKDARLYAGPYPVVAHPPCERWGRYWYGGPSIKVRLKKGDDNGCFEAALAAVRAHGGVLEHPAASAAWRHFGLKTPPRAGGWVSAGLMDDGWTCCVDQLYYGHRAQKATWLYAVDCDVPMLRWGKSTGGVRLEDGFHSTEERRRAVRRGVIKRLSHREREATPEPFRDLLLSMARSVYSVRERRTA